MQRAEIIVGEEYGLRENRQLGGPLQRVRIVQHVRGTKWRAEWVEPNLGLVDYVDGRTLLVRWKDSTAFVAHEAAERRHREANEAHRYDDESPLAGAVYAVFDAAGDRLHFNRGDLYGPPDALERVRSRAGINPTERTDLEYVDRLVSRIYPSPMRSCWPRRSARPKPTRSSSTSSRTGPRRRIPSTAHRTHWSCSGAGRGPRPAAPRERTAATVRPRRGGGIAHGGTDRRGPRAAARSPGDRQGHDQRARRRLGQREAGGGGALNVGLAGSRPTAVVDRLLAYAAGTTWPSSVLGGHLLGTEDTTAIAGPGGGAALDITKLISERRPAPRCHQGSSPRVA